MARLDNSIYGLDENSFAASIADDALGSPNPNRYSGNPLDQEARSKGVQKTMNPNEKGGQYDSQKTSVGTGNDSRASVKGNHGAQD